MKIPFDIQLKAAGIPQPEKEYRFMPSRRFRFDLAWPDKMTALEIEGGAWVRGRHVNPLGFLKDLEKYGEAFALGWDVLRVSPQQLENGTALRWLKARMERT